LIEIKRYMEFWNKIIATLVNIGPNTKYTNFGIRIFAHLLDAVLIMLPLTLLSLSFLYPLIIILLWVILKGQTIGKKLTGIRIVTYPDCQKIDGTTAFIRMLGYFVNVITFGIGFLIIPFRDDKRGLHDLIADTCVIYEKQLPQNIENKEPEDQIPQDIKETRSPIFVKDFSKNNKQLNDFLDIKNTPVITNTEVKEKSHNIQVIEKEKLYEELKAYRLKTSKKENIAAYMVFSNAELEELISQHPTCEQELLRVKGFGKKKIEKYGKDILKIFKEKDCIKEPPQEEVKAEKTEKPESQSSNKHSPKTTSISYRSASGNNFLKTWFNTGVHGEYLIYAQLKNLKGYNEIMTNLYLPKADGSTTEIDLIMISETGIYVFESKNYSGWIFGDEKNKNWVQTLPKGGKKYRFFNPIWQNNGHITALKSAVGIKNNYYFKSYIVFSERCTLKKINVTSSNVRVLNRNILFKTIQEDIKNSPKLMTIKEIDEVYSKLQEYILADKTTKKAHIKSINNSH